MNELRLEKSESFEYLQCNLLLQQYRDYLYEDNGVAAVFGRLERLTHVDRVWLALCTLIVVLCYIFLGNGASILSSVIGVSYPVYATAKAMESRTVQDGELKRWLKYWIAYSVLGAMDSVILLTWLPSFLFLKLMLLIWCMMPVTWNGSEVLYRTLVKPFFLKYQLHIDHTLSNITERIVQVQNINLDISGSDLVEPSSD